jgi:carboxyl-terminal processing protease
MGYWKIFLMAYIFSFGCVYALEQDLLKIDDISRIMQQILKQHVDKKEISSKIVEGSLLIYINQFDPQRIYLLEEETQPFLHLSSDKIKQIIQQYQQKNFSLFVELNQVVQKSIERARQLRKEVLTSLPKNIDPQLLVEPIRVHDSFAKSVDELKERWRQNLYGFLAYEKKLYPAVSTLHQFEPFIQNYENRLKILENQYIYQNEEGNALSPSEQENLFSIHVLKALASSLDAHTSFYQNNEAYDMRVRLQKEFQGIGLILKDMSQGVIVTRMVPDGPAARSGLIKPGDILVEIDHNPIKSESFKKVMEKLHGEKNSIVELSFKRKEEGKADQIYLVKLTREAIILNNDRVDVSSEVFGNGIIGKINLHGFYQGTDVSSEKDVKDAIEQLEKKGHLKGLILDLRNNSGGFLSQAVKVAGLFITNGVVVISKYANGTEKIYRDMDSKVSYDGPLIVLTSKATASAAEIVAQALQDYGVALVVGDEHTYGKGTIQTQTVTDNQSSSYFKVTVGKYYTVSGHTPQKEGVKADIVAPSHWSRETIGEKLLDSTIEADHIPSVYEDQLSDVSPDTRSWYLKYYMPTLQNRTTIWRDFLPVLRKNSQYRIQHNQNYQIYIKGKPLEESEENEWNLTDKKDTYGEDDLQMQEAVNILKDMILLKNTKK